MTAARYARQGFASLRGVIDRDAAGAALSWIRRNRDRSDLAGTRDLFDRRVPAPIKIRRLWNADPGFWSEFLADSGVLRLIRDHAGESWMLIRSAAFIKYGGTRSTVGWHRDEDLWAHPCRQGLTLWIPLTPAPEESGCLSLLPGSHRAPARDPHWDLTHPYHKVLDVAGLGEPELAPVAVGDCILIDKRCVHSSGPNLGPDERVGLVLAFADCDPGDINESAAVWRDGGWIEVAPAA